MKFNSTVIIRPITSSIIAALMLSGLSVSAMADNKAALKSAIGNNIKIAAETKTTDIKVAKSSAAPANEDFKKLDLNQDGEISLKEAVKDKTLAGIFDAVDANHDGTISADEHAAYKTSLPAKTTEN
ncbi:MAG: hypothetical protein A3I83_02130 [Methylotenera sp. RIFCSPLOWO2_02_FULL_45_14]|nr:MAG: hypothetical protein A3I83_02130 [Methylotenera sp. RIFCSPLOWO2_02_FULL_45_14]